MIQKLKKRLILSTVMEAKSLLKINIRFFLQKDYFQI